MDSHAPPRVLPVSDPTFPPLMLIVSMGGGSCILESTVLLPKSDPCVRAGVCMGGGIGGNMDSTMDSVSAVTVVVAPDVCAAAPDALFSDKFCQS